MNYQGLEVRRHPLLAGQEKGYQFGDGPVMVSPAIYALLADPATRELTVDNLTVVRVPAGHVFLPWGSSLPVGVDT